jgi:hypothetical protein
MNEQEVHHLIPANLLYNPDLLKLETWVWGPLMKPNYQQGILDPDSPEYAFKENVLKQAHYQSLPVFEYPPVGTSTLTQKLLPKYLQKTADLDSTRFLTLVCGRKYFQFNSEVVPPGMFEVNLPANQTLLSYKGVGSTSSYINDSSFHKERPHGFTHAGVEQSIEKMLTEECYEFPRLDGSVSNRRMSLNRFTIATAEIKSVIDEYGELLTLNDLDPKVYHAVADLENPLVEIVQINHLEVTIHDFISHLSSAKVHNDIRGFYSYDHSLLEALGSEPQAILEYYLQYFYVALANHPYYAQHYQDSKYQLKTRDFLVNWYLPRLLSSFAEILYDSAYILSSEADENDEYFNFSFHDHRIDNLTFAGHQDLGDVKYLDLFDFQKSRSHIFESEIEQGETTLEVLVRNLTLFLSPIEQDNLYRYFQTLWREPIKGGNSPQLEWVRKKFRTALENIQ